MSKLGILIPRGRAFVTGLLAVIAFKLWLVHNEEIYGYTTFYDCLWFLNSAKHWYWGMPYSWTAFFRPPAYPLFIALVHEFGIPLRIAIELLQIGGYSLLVAALRKLQIPRWVCLSIFAAIVLHPASFQLNNYVEADTLYAAALTYTTSGLIFTLLTRRLTPAIGSGVGLAVLWNTREESFLLPVLFLSYLVVAFLRERIETNSSYDVGKILLRPAMSIFATAVLLILAVNTANYCCFGDFAKSETSGRSFRAAYRALLRIKPSQPKRLVAVTREARQLAYGVSPTFAKLKPLFESSLGDGWELETSSSHGIPREIGTAWFMWAFRDVASHAGAHQNPRKAHRFYRDIAREINRACRRGRIPSRFVIADFLSPDFYQYLGFLPESFGRIASLFVFPHKISLDREDAILRSPERSLYDEMAGRRASLTHIGTLRIVGWAFQFGDPLQLVAYDSGGGEIPSAATHFSPRSDIVESFRDRGDVPANMEFGLPIEVRRGNIPAGDLLFVTKSGRKFVGSTNSVLSGAPPRENGAPDGSPLICRIFAQEFTPSSETRSLPTENFISNYHRYFVIAFSYAAIPAILLLGIFFRRVRIGDPLNGAILLLAVTVASRVALFVLIDATCFTGRDVRYLFPVMPLYSALLILLIYQAAQLALPARAAPLAKIDN